MKVKILYENAEKIHDNIKASAQFAVLSPEGDLREQILNATLEQHHLLWLDLTALTDSKASEIAKMLDEPEYQMLDNAITLFVAMPVNEIAWTTITRMATKPEKPFDPNDLPYKDVDLMAIVNVYHLPWQAIYSEYFWTGIADGGNITLFDNKTFTFNDADVALFILGSRYFGKVKNVFKFTPDEQQRLTDTFKSITLVLHGTASKLPISKATDLVANYNIGQNFNSANIAKYLGNDQGNFSLVIANVMNLVNDISDFLKRLNFDYWLRAIAGRMTIEKNKAAYIAKYSIEDYANSYHAFSSLEHSTDFVFVSLFTLVNKAPFDAAFAKAQEFMSK